MALSYKVRKVVEFNRADLEWFEETHPGSSFWWFVNHLIGAYREVVEGQEPNVMVREAAKLAQRQSEE